MPRYITEVVRLRSASVTEYNRIIDDIEEGRPYNAKLYEPSKTCIARYHARGDMQVIHREIARLEAQAASVTGRDRTKPASNAALLAAYRDQFALPLRPAAPGTPGPFRSYRHRFGNLTVIAKPHLAVEDRKGRRKFLYLVTSKDWEVEDVRFAAHLLSEIVTANVPGSVHADVEVLDWRRGRRVAGAPLTSRESNALQQLAQLLELRGLN